MTIRLTPTIQCDQQSVSSLCRPSFMLSSSTSFLMSFSTYLCSFDIQPQSSMPFSRDYHPHSSTHDHTNKHCHSQTSIILFNSNINSLTLLLRLNCTPHTAHIIDLFVHSKIPMLLSFRHFIRFCVWQTIFYV